MAGRWLYSDKDVGILCGNDNEDNGRRYLSGGSGVCVGVAKHQYEYRTVSNSEKR